MPQVTISLTIGSLNAGRQVKYSVANSLTPAEVFVQADSVGAVSVLVDVPDVALVYKFTLPDGQYFHLPVLSTDTILALGTIPIYRNGVPQGLEDITALISQRIAPAAQPTAFADITGQPTDNTNLAAVLALKLNIARTVVPSAAATVSPTLADSGKEYRLTNASATFRLPTGGTPGSTVYYVQGVGGIWGIDGGTNGQTVEWVGADTGSGNSLVGRSSDNIDSMLRYAKCELRCEATDIWSMTGTIAPFS